MQRIAIHAACCAGLLCAALASAEEPASIRIDAEQWRDLPVKHLFLHGTLNGATGFHVLLPEAGLWRGRLIHFIGGGMGGVDNAGLKTAAPYALANGAVYVESSQGHLGTSYMSPGDTPADLSYAASYAVVQYARSRCVQLYGKLPSHSYVFGGSGGGFRSSRLLERFPKLYDGAVPTLGAGTIDVAIRLHSLYENYRPLLQSKVAAIDDVFRPGGSGRLSDALQAPEERHAMEALLEAGFPRNSILFMRPNPAGVSLKEYLKYKADPSYFDDYWKECRGCESAVVEGIEGTVTGAAGFRLATDLSRPDDELFGYTAVFPRIGQSYTVMGNSGRSLTLSPHGPDAAGLRPGDRFSLNNRELLAWRAFYGQPRPKEKAAALSEPDVPVGLIKGKMIAMFGADDFNVWPSIGVRYHKAVIRALGTHAGDHFRIHFFEHGVHGGASPDALGRQVPDGLVTYKALDDLMAWVERGVAPPPGASYSLDKNNQLVLPKSAAQRGGYQPVVELRAGGQLGRLEISAGTEVQFHAEAEDPDNQIVKEEIDFEGDNKFDAAQTAQGKKVAVDFSHRYERPGTYFATVRVTDSTVVAGAPSHGLQNLATVRVVVTDWERLSDGSTGRVTEVRSADGTRIAAYIRRPRGDGPFPVVVALHGGAGSKDATINMGRSTAAPVQDFVAEGWAVFSIDFRPNATFEPAEWKDTIAAIEAVRRYPFVDAQRVALLGASHGGHTMARVAARVDVRCAALWSPSALDLTAMKHAADSGAGVDKPRLNLLISMMEKVKDPEGYLRGSAFTEAAQIRCPLLIVNGRNDISSPLMIMEPYVAKLREAGKEVETYFPENGPHGFYFGNPEIPESQEARRLTLKFFSKHLQR